MQIRIFGISVSALGIIALMYAGLKFINGGAGNFNIRRMILMVMMGIICFFVGVAIVKNSREKEI